MSNWNWRPIEAKNGPRYEVLLAHYDALGGWEVTRDFARIDLKHRWWYCHGTQSMAVESEPDGARVLAFRPSEPMKEDADRALTVVREAP